MSQPFFTIGVPTYNRRGLLKLTISSILSQDFSDFEVIVGNDFTSELLTAETLGIFDPRIRFVNHPVNLREVGNMNALLAMAKGRYFTWLFDDDLYEPGFLSAAHTSLLDTGSPQAFFTSYRTIDDNDSTIDDVSSSGRVTLMDGEEFLTSYFSGHLKLISTCGMFDTEALRNIVGGVKELCDSPIGLYCEYLFLVRCGLFSRIIHLDSPFVVFRAHSESWGKSNTELEKYLDAGHKLLQQCGETFHRLESDKNLNSNLAGVCNIHLVTFATKSVMFEINGGSAGLFAACRAVGRFFKEAYAIRKQCIAIPGCGGIIFEKKFLIIVQFCTRLMLGKLWDFRRDRADLA